MKFQCFFSLFNNKWTVTQSNITISYEITSFQGTILQVKTNNLCRWYEIKYNESDLKIQYSKRWNRFRTAIMKLSKRGNVISFIVVENNMCMVDVKLKFYKHINYCIKTFTLMFSKFLLTFIQTYKLTFISCRQNKIRKFKLTYFILSLKIL